MTRKQTLDSTLHIRLTRSELERLEQLSEETGKSKTYLVRNSINRYLGYASRAHIKRIIHLANSMPDPFGELEDPQIQHNIAMARLVGDSDRELAGLSLRLEAEYRKERDAETSRDLRPTVD